MQRTFLFTLITFIVIHCSQADAAVESGFNSSTLAQNDDGSVFVSNIGFQIDFFGVQTQSLYVNNNGNVTFTGSLSTFTPFNLTSTGRTIIAPFFADVDTRNGTPVTYGTGTFDSRATFGVNWVDVGHFSGQQDHPNSFQLLLVDRSNIGAGDFDIIFNYDEILWETGEASGGNADGLGGSSARVGYSNGQVGPNEESLELAGSAINGALIDGGPNALVSNSLNSVMDGRYIFNVRGGQVVDTGAIPEPTSLIVWGLLGAVGLKYRRRR